MHLPDGILPVSVLAAGYAATGAVTWYSMRRIGREEDPREGIPKASLLTAAFFVASLIHIPVPPTSVHLILNGLLGVVLGWYAFPAVLVGLFFQAVMFQHGGLTTLGVNAAVIGGPALLAYGIFRLRRLRPASRTLTGVLGFLGGAAGVGITVLLLFALLITTIPAELDAAAERTAIYALVLAHVPLMLIEGVFTAMVVLFLLRVRPELLGEKRRPPEVAVR
ncbi:cobalt transporter CbiM [Rubrobacter taiwanensis]|uniref:Cobalt transporter CbiM n=1 Tax=Rubrobacter taiwanensis TaxID=185139 RepID=A0A4R1B9Y1_9ACTN|nr:cobalt transporter CbiM [Rubrobacter taiwanensis]TCJ13708.1 cobalt transporter CbiM [Rubrobacter taiwanensis]